jgi:hypothetical protein
MGGGSYYELTPEGIIAAGVAYNPHYGKMAADNIAKEVEERQLIAPAAETEDIAGLQELASPVTRANEITSGGDHGARKSVSASAR